MNSSLLPEKIFVLCSDPGQKLKKSIFAIPDNMFHISEQGTDVVCIWTNKEFISGFLNNYLEGKDAQWVELDRDDFIFNLFMFSEEYKYFVVNPTFSKQSYEYFESEYHPEYEGNLFPLDDPIIFRELIAKKLKQLKVSNDCIKNIIARISVLLFFKTDLFDVYQEECKTSKKNKNSGKGDRLTKKKVLGLVSSWERRHDSWVGDHLSEILGSQFTTMTDIKEDLKNSLMSDWRASLGFFLDRTTYQSRKDVINLRTANYLFSEAMKLPQKYSNQVLENFSDNIYYDKLSERITHLRIPIDTERVESISNFLKHSKEKNFTKIVLEKTSNEKDCIDFLKSFRRVGPKTANFYMKFIAWVFDLDFVAVTVDRHVYNSLLKYDLITEQNYENSTKIIRQLAKKMNLSPIYIETALYEESWIETNNL